tara:strand:+ start:252 stop:392 length:141 start_codon:yes stop_codon:yes gene_type:complete
MSSLHIGNFDDLIKANASMNEAANKNPDSNMVPETINTAHFVENQA